jgi:hypothetical protein
MAISQPAPTDTPPLRAPDEVMIPERVGAFHQSRISFTRSIVRKMMREQWRIESQVFELDHEGYGTVVYAIHTPHEHYSLVIFSHYLDPAQRSDRVIAEKWDIACVLCEGAVTPERLETLRTNVPRQETGRNCCQDIVLSRANKSVRNFDYIVGCLAEGRQPDPTVLARVGYLFRTTAVYGNGKFGIADYARIRETRAFALPFSAQLFAVYLLRHFSIELVEHLARVRAPATAVPLSDAIRRYIGTGNATGLGMAPFLVNHPRLIDRWVRARETAIARVVHEGRADTARLQRLEALIRRALTHFGETVTDDQRQQRNYQGLTRDLVALQTQLTEVRPEVDSMPGAAWRRLVAWTRDQCGLEAQELLNSLLVELYPELVDELENCTAADETPALRPQMPVAELLSLIQGNYRWALELDFERPEEQQRFWYRSMEKEEPRLGERLSEPGADKEMRLTTVARDVQILYGELAALPPDAQRRPVVYFLLRHPEHRGLVRRVQSLEGYEYGEIRGNLLHKDCLPIHLLRCKLSFFGAGKFDPKSDRWVRITLFQGAPLVSDIGKPFHDDWCFPVMPQAGANP